MRSNKLEIRIAGSSCRPQQHQEVNQETQVDEQTATIPHLSVKITEIKASFHPNCLKILKYLDQSAFEFLKQKNDFQN